MPSPVDPRRHRTLSSRAGTGATAGIDRWSRHEAAKKTVSAKDRHALEVAIREGRAGNQPAPSRLRPPPDRSAGRQPCSRGVTWPINQEEGRRTIERSTVKGVTATARDSASARKLVEEATILQGTVSAVVSSIAAKQAAIAGVRSSLTRVRTAISVVSGRRERDPGVATEQAPPPAVAGVVAGRAVATGAAVAPRPSDRASPAIRATKATQAEKYSADVDTAIAERSTWRSNWPGSGDVTRCGRSLDRLV